MDEMLVFAEHTRFNVLFLRKQETFYDEQTALLEKKRIKIQYISRDNFSINKVIYCFLFAFRHLNCFFNYYSFIYGIKSLGYFLKLDLDIFLNEQNNLHCQFATQAAILGLMIKEYPGTTTKYSVTFHAYDIYVKNLWFTTLYKNAGKFISISNYNINYVLNRYKLTDTSKLIYSPLGVFPPHQICVNTSSDKMRIGFLSYFVEMKGILYLLPALKELKKQGVKFIFNLAGDGPLKNEILSYIRKKDLADVVIYHGLVKNEEKEHFFKNLDVFILPSVSLGMETDGLPVVLMEAVSYGLPLITTNISGIPEICINDFNGYLIEQKSIDEIANALLKFCKNPGRWPEFARNSLGISKKFDIVTNSKTKLKILGWD